MVVDVSKETEKKNKVRDYHLRTTYGITLNEYNQKLAQQDHKCALCSKPAADCAKSLHVDHNHKKLTKEQVKNGQKFKKVRGLLCFHCNRELVRRHTIKTARLLLAYLLKYDEPEQPNEVVDAT